MAATVTEIAKEAGVSISLVSRMLRGDPKVRVSERRRQEILGIKQRLGGVAPRGTAKNRTPTNIVLVPTNRIFTPEWLQINVLNSQMMRSFESALRGYGLRMYFAFLDEAEMAESPVRSIYHGECDALLLLDQNLEWLAEFLKTRYFPHVSTYYPAEQYRVNTVHSHESEGFRLAIEHLRGLGHRRIGFAGVQASYRFPLTVAAIAAAGLPIDESLHCWIEPPEVADPYASLRRHARQAMAAWLDRRPAATALVCSTDVIALGVLEVMRERGLVPGKDLSIIGHSNHEVRGREPVDHPVITTVDSPVDLVGQRAAELLVNQIRHDQTMIVHEHIPTTLIVRTTTGPAPEF